MRVDEPARPDGPVIIHGRKTRRVSRGALSRCKKLGVSKSEQTELRARPDVSAPLGVGAPGLEPGTSALSGPRSDHLSYAPASSAAKPGSEARLLSAIQCSFLSRTRCRVSGRAAYAQDGAREADGCTICSAKRSAVHVIDRVLVRGSVSLHCAMSASARISTRREILEAGCPIAQHQHLTA